jgi:predicted Zn-dependent protease
MDRRHFTFGCGCCGVLASLSAFAWEAPPRFGRPEAATDEGGLWAFMDREEARLKRSRFLVDRKELQKYISDIACRLAGDHCPDIRTYLVRSPFFNASMAPNGMLQLWSGLLLRMANEAQLAAIIGHEIGHYLARHSLDQLRDAKSRSAFGQFLGIFLGAAGAGGAAVGLLGQLALIAGMFAYSRENELQADEIGLELMSRAGYAPQEAPRIWQQLVDEYKGDPENEATAGSILFATHPAPADRLEKLASLAQKMPTDGHVGKAAFVEAIHPIRRDLLQDELKRRRPGETLVLLDRLIGDEPGNGELLFFRGEAFRLRNASGDPEKSLAAYQSASETQSPPAELFRSMGLLQRKIGQPEAARQSFRIYLQRKPNAEDAELIRVYLEEGS